MPPPTGPVLDDASATVKFLVQDRDGRPSALIDHVLADAGFRTALTAVRTPLTNAVAERWVRTCRHEVLDRTLVRNQRHLVHALREFERHENGHRPHRALDQTELL